MEIDLSCDIGEGFGCYRIADDFALLRIVSSANVACGFHAGDPSIMAETIAAAHALGVTVGGHFGKPDLAGFGRRELEMTADQIYAGVIYQCGALSLMADALDTPMRYVSFHGNLGSIVGQNEDLVARLARVWLAMASRPRVQGMPDSPLLLAAERCGLATIPVFLSDRAYRSDGTPVPRGQPGAVLHDVNAVRSRVRQLIETGRIPSIEGDQIALSPKSIVIHSDTPGSLELGTAIRGELDAMGVAVRFPSA